VDIKEFAHEGEQLRSLNDRKTFTPLDKIMHYVYVLKSLKDNKWYVGRTEDLKKRLEEHHKGRVKSTSDRRPLKWVYCEIGSNIKDAVHREKYLKSAWGKRYLKHRLKHEIA